MKSARLQILNASVPGNSIDRNIKGCFTSPLFLQQSEGPEIETGRAEDPLEEGLLEWDLLSPPNWRRYWLLYGILPCHPMQHPGPSNSLCIVLLSLPSASCLPSKVELLARFIKARRRAQQQKKKKINLPRLPSLPWLTRRLSPSRRKPTECPGRHFIYLHLPLFKAKSSPEKASLHPKDMVSTKW